MKRVTGIGGVFFKSEDPKNMQDWYNKHLGIEMNEWSGMFQWRDIEDKEKVCTTVWSPFEKKTDYFDPSTKDYMFNYRVENLSDLLEQLKKEGVEVIDKIEEYEYGKFGWIMDPEGRKIELWEPVDQPFSQD